MRHVLAAVLLTVPLACDRGAQTETTPPAANEAGATTTEGTQVAGAVAPAEVTDENVFDRTAPRVEIPEDVVAEVGPVAIETETFRAIYDLHAKKWSERRS